MAVSQFTIYSSSDASAPTLSGSAGTLLTVLDKCLVDGYGAKSAAGWSKPIANASNIGCYKNGTGSTQLNLVVNDAAVNATPGAREATATGWETLAGIASGVGTGTGQFPVPAQMNTTGYVAWHKSSSADGTVRAWTVAADAHTFYMWVDYASTGVYTHWGFGDLFALKPTTDAYRCFIYGDTGNTNTINSGTALTDTISIPQGASAYAPTFAMLGHFAARTWGGGGTSITAGKTVEGSGTILTTQYGVMQGYYGLGPDNAIYISPVKWFEPTTGAFRGRMRGLYSPLHQAALFANGQTFSGGGDYAGKTFMIIKLGVNSGYWALETSNTVETN